VWLLWLEATGGGPALGALEGQRFSAVAWPSVQCWRVVRAQFARVLIPLPIGKGAAPHSAWSECVPAWELLVKSMIRAAERRTLFTIGHSNRSAADLIAILHSFGVARVVDVRSIPRSATHPQFESVALESALRRAQIAYTHLSALGGRRPKSKLVAATVNAGWRVSAFHNYADYAQSQPFQVGLGELLKLASREACAILCAEVLWWRCHRRIVTDYVLAQGVPVRHLFTESKSEDASLTPFAVIDHKDRCISYPATEASQPVSLRR
jgi:hypothetical protein